MTCDVVFTHDAHLVATKHLLQHFDRGTPQEDLCFALWRPSTGSTRQSALIDEIILPLDGDRDHHGNVSFNPEYFARSVSLGWSPRGRPCLHAQPSEPRVAGHERDRCSG